MTSILIAVALLALLGRAKFADVDPVDAAKSLAKSGIDAIFGAASVSAAPVNRGPGITLKYGTLSVFVPEDKLGESTVHDLFRSNSSGLGGLSIGDSVNVRDTNPADGGVVEDGDTPTVGRTYVASVRKEDKGN